MMTRTEIQLLAVHRSPVLPLKDVSEKYFGCTYDQAKRLANLNTLPIPAFRLSDSHKSPWCVNASDLAAHLDTVFRASKDAWTRSQI